MKRLGKIVFLLGILIILGLVAINPAWGAQDSAALEFAADQAESGMPGWPVPDKPIPQHEPGRPSRAGNYSTQITQVNAAGEEEVVSLTGLDAMLADGVIDNPLAGGYRLVSKEDIAFGVFDSTGSSLDLRTYENITVTHVANSEISLAPVSLHSLDITSGDLNGDGVDEQIAAWVDADSPDQEIYVAIGEMPGTNGRSSSDLAAAAYGENIDLVVRGYDQALWHVHYNGTTWGEWNNDGGGLLLSGPAIASRGSADFDIFAVSTDNQIYQTSWNGSIWSGWTETKTDTEMAMIPAWIGPPPELPAPAVVASGADEFDIFRLAPDNTLRWNHSDDDGATWGDWQDLGGMLASGPGAVLLDDGRLQVFAIGVDQTLWYLRSDGTGWENWQRVPLDGMNPGVVIVSAPTPVLLSNGDVRVYGRGSDDALWQVTYDGTWGTWSKGGGDLASRPAAAGSDLFALAPSGKMLHSSDEGDTWNDFANPWLPACCLGTPINTGIRAYVTAKTNPVDQINVLDIETGHFLGDGRQQIALAYTWDDPEKESEEFSDTGIGLRLYDINDGFRTLSPIGGLGGTEYEDKDYYVEDYYPKIAVGEFDGDAAQEIALAYATRKGGVRVYRDPNFASYQIAWLKEGDYHLYYPNLYGSDMENDISSIKVTKGWEACFYENDWENSEDKDDKKKCLGEGEYPDLHDVYYEEPFDGENLYNSISYVEVRQVGDPPNPVDVTDGINYQRNAYVALEIFDFNPLNSQDPKLTSQAVDYFEMKFTDTDDFPAPERTLVIAAGDFDGTLDSQGKLDDEIALIWDKVCWGSLCEHYRAYFHILDVDGENISAHPYYDDEDEDDEKGDVEILKCHLDAAIDPYSSEINLAVGDFDGDGKDEIARTWPRKSGDWPTYDCFDSLMLVDIFPLLRRNLEVLDWNEVWSTSEPIELDGAPAYNYKDAMAAGDLDLDLKDEIVYLNAHDDGDSLRIYSFTPTIGISPLLGGVEPIPDLSTDIPVLATGDFTGESLRVGPPTYRVQNRVDSLEALINMPPKHRDLVKDTNGDYQLVEVLTEPCWDTPADPRCSHAKHGGKEGEQSEIETKVERDWAIGAGLKSKFSYGYAFVDYSMEYSYGENFSKTETTINAQTFTQYATAYNHDKIVYYGMPYRVWEYPIYGDNTNEPLDYITVLFPVAEDMDGELYTPSPDTATGDFPGEPYYAPRHQTYNVWSYDPIGEVRFPDYEEENLILDKTISGGGDWFEVNSSQSSAIITTHTQVHDFSAEVGWGSKGSVSIMPFTSLKFSWKVRAHVKGSYAQNDIQTDKLTTTSETMLSVGISEQDNYLSFMIRPIAYWTEAGYLVLDYQTEMGDWGVWDDDGEYYNKPDPAFILPWYGFPDPDDPIPPASPALKLYSYDVQVSPVFASVGDTVTISATVRNFSNFPPDEAVIIRFFLGDPSDNILIGEDSIPQLDRPDGPQTATITWTAAGVGKQKIYAVIDPQDNIEEVHDGDDLINNNIAYGRIQIGASDYGDMGLASDQAYQSLSYTQTNSLAVSAYFPPVNLEEIVRFELKDATLTVGSVVGNPFEVVAYLGSLDWNAKEDFSLKPDGTPPAVIAIAYADVDIAGYDESSLHLYRLSSSVWVDATCPGYDLVRFPEDNRLAVPICQTGTFVLSDQQPVMQRVIFLPLTSK